MAWRVTEDVEQFLAAAGALLQSDLSRHTVLLSSCENARAGVTGARFGWWVDEAGATGGAVVLRPPHPAYVTALPDAAVLPLVEALGPTAVTGPAPTAVQVAAVAARALGRPARLQFAERLFRLEQLAPPVVPGEPRVAGLEDAGLVVEWFHAFTRETGVVGGDEERSARDRIGYGGLVLWEVDGEPAAMAGHTRVAFGSGRIGPVYTPPDHRARGYGGAATCVAAQRLLDQGAQEVVLFTDLANATSNALYRRLGFVPVEDVAVLELA